MLYAESVEERVPCEGEHRRSHVAGEPGRASTQRIRLQQHIMPNSKGHEADETRRPHIKQERAQSEFLRVPHFFSVPDEAAAEGCTQADQDA